MLILDSSGLSRLAERSQRAAALIAIFRREGPWPPLVPTAVLAESTSGRDGDASINRFLKSCDIETGLSEATARRAGELRARARRGSAVDAIVVAVAEPSGSVLTTDRSDLEALAAYANGVEIDVV